MPFAGACSRSEWYSKSIKQTHADTQYRGEEDYRWPLLREQMPRWQWELFALFFIAITQIILLAATAVSLRDPSGPYRSQEMVKKLTQISSL